MGSGHQGAATQGATLLREKLSSQQVPRERLAVARGMSDIVRGLV